MEETTQTMEQTIDEMYDDIDYARLMFRQTGCIDDRIRWRNEIGRLTRAIRREQMGDGNR